jgi:hypothetical protein
MKIATVVAAAVTPNATQRNRRESFLVAIAPQ